ncbi:hypothetical protein HZU77_000970 [Neisseriaceae bacterium TC5R-5]|nr:hypothetical protein [Neisseriaceae bacterium TC5R-5]
MEIDIISKEDERRLNNLTLVVYILQALGLFTGGLGSLVAVIINHVKRDDTRGTLYESHFIWQIRTFWWTLLGMALGALLMVAFVGFIIMGAIWVWYVYRVVRGFLNFNDGKRMPI